MSIMLLDEGMDTGPVLAQEAVAISPGDDTGSLTEKLSRHSAALLIKTLAGWLGGEIEPMPQDEAEATYSGQISREQGKIDWSLSAEELWRRVRAFNPWPGCYSRWQGRQLKVVEAVPLPGGGGLAAGQVVALGTGEAAFGIATGEGILGVRRLQLEGKKAMSAEDFLRGQRGFVGSLLGDA